ncbi:MAG: hypothetical protein M3401_07475, partial [Actinomycetota bacterium]|nr:hypothetical protein [Actinomycetota bacterium]
QLVRLRNRGVFVIDLKPDPKLGDEPLDPYVPDLIARAVAHDPKHVFTIKATGPLTGDGPGCGRLRTEFPPAEESRRGSTSGAPGHSCDPGGATLSPVAQRRSTGCSTPCRPKP